MEIALLGLFVGALLLAVAGWLAHSGARERALYWQGEYQRLLAGNEDQGAAAHQVYEPSLCEVCGAHLHWQDCFVCGGASVVNHGGLNGRAAVAPCSECEGEGGWPYCPTADCVNHQRWEVSADE